MPTEHGFDEYFGILYSNDMMPPWVNTDRPLRLHRGTEPTSEYPVDQTTLTKRYTEEAIRFIRQSNGEPFFIYLPHAMPHLPIYASESFQGRSEGGRYGDTIEELDWSAGTILDVLKEEGLDDQTLVIFTSDNGPWRNMPPRMYDTEPVEKWDAGTSGPFMGEKGTTWEGGHRVPAIIRWPGSIPADKVSSEIATTMDLYTTILNLAGATMPDKAVDGLDIWPLVSTNAESPHTYYHYFWIDMIQGVRDETWKLRILPGESEVADPTTLLFDLHNDPYERYDVAADHPEIVDRLREEMVRFAGETGARLAFEP
jgi:arylsulfatase A-like enzyme